MTQPQRPKDHGGSRTQDEGGKKKQVAEAKVSASTAAEKPAREIVTQYAEQDKQDGIEIEDLAPVTEDDRPETGDYADEQAEEPIELKEDEGEILDQEEQEDGYDEQSSDSDEELSAEVAPHSRTQPTVKNPNYVSPNARINHPSLSRPSGEGVAPQAVETQEAARNDDSGSDIGGGDDQEDDGEDEGEILDREGLVEDYDEPSSEAAENASQEVGGAQDSGGPTETDDELVLRHVVALNASKKRTDEDRFNVVSVTVRDLYDDDPEAAMDPNSWKKDIQKKLRDHKQLEVNPRRLSDWIRGYGCWAGIYAKDPKVAPGFSAALELIAINDPEERFKLAVEIHEKKLSVRDTRRRVQEINSKKVDPRLVDKLMSKIKDPRSIPVSTDYEKMDEAFLENELSKKERLKLRTEIETKREQLTACGDFLDLLEKRLSDIDL